MGLFNPPPPTDGSSYPDIPLPNFLTAGQQLAKGALTGGASDSWIVKFWNYSIEAIGILLNWLVDKFDLLAAWFIDHLLAHVQGVGQPGMVRLMAAVLGDLLGIEAPAAELEATLVKGGRLKAMTSAGGWLFDTLTSEFTLGGASVPPGPASSPAKAFLGFLIEFAVRQGNLAYLVDLLPEQVDFFRGLREYGELLAKNLGLGRLARRALQPLIQILIADPLTASLNAQYRPKLLAEGSYVKAMQRGDLTRAQIDTWLSWLGYSEQAIDILIADTARPWAAHELIELARNGAMDDATAISLLQGQGIDQGTATQWWSSAKYAAADRVTHLYLGDVFRQFQNGFISWESARAAISEAKLLEEEKLGYYAVLGDKGSKFWRHLSEGELERAFIGGILDMTSVQTTWQNLGYSPDAIQTLTFLLLQKQSTSNKTKSGHIAHKALTEAQLEKAYKGGVINLAQIQAGWTNLGYSAADQEVLTALVTAATPAPGSTLLPGLTTP